MNTSFFDTNLWFGVKKEVKYLKEFNNFVSFISLYYFNNSMVFFQLEISYEKSSYLLLDEYIPIGEMLKDLCLTLDEDERYSYDEYITPLFIPLNREIKINELLNRK